MGADKSDFREIITSKSRLEESKGEVFLIHGFTGNPGDLEKISNFLNKQGYDTIRVLLKRHKEDEEEKGQNYRNVNDTEKWQEWIVKPSLQLINYINQKNYENRETHILGFSMGGSIALFLDSLKEERKINIKSIITINAPLYSPYKKDFPKVKAVVKLFSFLPKSISRKLLNIPTKEKPEYIRSEFSQSRKTPLIGAKHLSDFLEFLEYKRLSKVKSPIFIAQSMKDETVPNITGKLISNNVSSKIINFKEYENSSHFIMFDKESDKLFSDITNFYNILENQN